MVDLRIIPRQPNLWARVHLRLSVRKKLLNYLGLRVPRGYGWLRNPKKALYNRIYNRTRTKLF